MLQDLLKEFTEKASAEKAKVSSWFFKTGKGQYGEKDQFIGLTVPEQRRLAKKYQDLSLLELENLISSPIHEHRLTALFILVTQYKNTKTEVEQKKIVAFYLRNLKYVNNWDLVDSSASYILGPWFFTRNKDFIYKLAHSKNLWEKRVAMLTTFHFIREKQFTDSLKIAEMLLQDREDLIQKAVGWMLREVGKRDLKVEEEFLDKHYQKMPRTMLRYAIEKFSLESRQHYLGKV